MSRFAWITAALALVLVGCGGGDDEPAEVSPATVTVTGTATVAGQPIVGGRVALASTSGTPVAETTTDDTGKYTVTAAGNAVGDDVQVTVAGGEFLGAPFDGTLHAYHGRTRYQAADTTLATSLVAILANARSEATASARFDAALSRMTALGLLVSSDWMQREPSTVATEELLAQVTRRGIDAWLQSTAAELANDNELSSALVRVFPRAQGGIYELALGERKSVTMMRGISNSETIGIDANAPVSDYAYSIIRGPAGASVDSDGVLRYSPPEAGPTSSEVLEVEVKNKSTQLGRRLLATIEVLPVETALQGTVGAEGGVLMNDWQDVVLTVPEGAVPRQASLRVVRATDASGVVIYSLRSDVDMVLPARLKAPAVTASAAPPATAAQVVAGGRAKALADAPSGWTTRKVWGADYLKMGFLFRDRQATSINRLKSDQDCQLLASTVDRWGVSCRIGEVSSQLESYCSAEGECAGKIPVMFIHGYIASGVISNFPNLGGGPKTWGTFREDLKSDGKAVYEFRWRTNSNFKDVAAELEQAIKIARADTGRPVHLVAHSFGGLLARTYLQGAAAYGRMPYDAADVATLTAIGTPHSGISDTDAELHGVSLPKGQDSSLFEGCLQISCHLAGEPSKASYLFRTSVLLEPVSFAQAFGMSEAPGEFPALLFGNSDQFPVDVLSIHGLNVNTTPFGTTLTDGDNLISFSGMRFKPDLRMSPTSPTPLLLSGGKKVTEIILDNEPGTLPGDRFGWTERRPRGYVHTSVPVGTCPCEVFIDNPNHPTLKAVRDWLQSSPTSDLSTVPTRIEFGARIIDESTDAVIPGATLRAVLLGVEHGTAESGSDGLGRLQTNFYPNLRMDLHVSAPGYRNVVRVNRLAHADTVGTSVRDLGTISLAPDQLVVSSISGQVIDAVTAAPLANVSVSLITPYVERGVVSDGAGRYRFDGLVPGSFELEFRLNGYIDQTRDVTIAQNANVLANSSMTPRLAAGQARIRLSWGTDPRDLDSHLRRFTSGSQDYFVYFGNKRGVDAMLDLDDTNGEGPETITISPTSSSSNYRYVVHRYAGSGSIATSGAVVTVNTATEERLFYAPPETGEYWYVFDIVGGQVVPCQSGCMYNSWPQPLGVAEMPLKTRQEFGATKGGPSPTQ